MTMELAQWYALGLVKPVIDRVMRASTASHGHGCQADLLADT